MKNNDLTLFLTRPWSLFFITVGLFSAVFPWYQKLLGTKKWTLVFMPVLSIAVSLPLFMMNGLVRPGIGGALLLLGCYQLWKRNRGGWELSGPIERQYKE